MTRIAIIYHSEKGRTEIMAHEIAKGAQSVNGARVSLHSVNSPIDWNALHECDAMIFGSPVYMGSVSAQFKKFMDQSGETWMKHGWKNKIAGAFVNSHSYSGDKQGVLLQLMTYAAQHGMIWVGAGDMPSGSTPDDINRLASFIGVMSQSDTSISSVTPPNGDRKTGFEYGKRVAEITAQFLRGN